MPTTLTHPDVRTGPHKASWTGSGWGTQVLVLTRRSLRALVSSPQLVAFSLLQPLIMLTVFTQVFGLLLQSSPAFPAGVTYVDYLLPAILVTTGIGAAQQSGMGLVADMSNGALRRFRTLPIRLSSLLVARGLADLVRTTTQLVLLLGAGALLFGFSPGGGLPGVTGALLLAVAVSWALTWVFLALAAWLRSTESMAAVGFITMFPLMFASSAYVPLDGLPGWLRAIAVVNPLSYAVDAARDLTLGHPAGSGVALALLSSAVLTLVCMAVAARGFARPMRQ